MEKAEIGTLIHYPVPPHLSDAYAKTFIDKLRLPIAEELSRTVISLPMGPHMKIQDADYVIAAINYKLK